MKLVRFGSAGQEKPGILDGDGKIRDLSGVVRDITGEALSPEGLARIRNTAVAGLPLAPNGARLGPCVGNVGNYIAIGLNYADHAAESNPRRGAAPRRRRHRRFDVRRARARRAPAAARAPR